MASYWQRIWQKTRRVWQEEGWPGLLRKGTVKLLHKGRLGWQKLVLHPWRRTQQRRRFQRAALQDAPKTAYRPLSSSWVPLGKPLVSVVIVTGDRPQALSRCLAGLQAMAMPLEIWVVDLGTQPWPPVAGVHFWRSPVDWPVPAAVAAIWPHLQGEYCWLLGVEWEPTAAALSALLTVLKEDPAVAIATGKRMWADQSLVGAGTVIWQDGSLWDYGAGDFAGEPEYNYRRPTDACGAVGWLARREVCLAHWEAFGSWQSLAYAAADLSLRAGAVQYVPTAVLVGDRAIAPVDGLPAADRPRFAAMWAAQLSRHCPRRADTLEQAPRRFATGRTLLVVDTLVPPYDQESGALRLFRLLELWQRAGYHIIFLPDYGHDQAPYTNRLEAMGIEVLYFTWQQQDPWARLVRRLPVLNWAWVCRPELCAKYFPILQRRPELPRIYDTIDLHFLRLQREWELNGRDPQQREVWENMRRLEQRMAAIADLTVAVTAEEQALLQTELGAKNVAVVPNLHEMDGALPLPFADRQGLLFIGGYYHQPNVDAVVWLCTEILPLVWGDRPEITVTLLGSNPPATVQALANERVQVPGYLPNVDAYFRESRWFVAPLRYGAGMKGKIGQSLSFRLPVITTPIGAEGLSLQNGYNCAIATTAAEFADCILRLYDDSSTWEKYHQRCAEVLAPFQPQAIGDRLHTLLQSLK
ncbi:MAG: glycosyltransferase family 4 protein [Pseudanabaenaceae cyanobacterium]